MLLFLCRLFSSCSLFSSRLFRRSLGSRLFCSRLFNSLLGSRFFSSSLLFSSFLTFNFFSSWLLSLLRLLSKLVAASSLLACSSGHLEGFSCYTLLQSCSHVYSSFGSINLIVSTDVLEDSLSRAA